MRESGILLPMSSLASKFGIGCISRESYEFVDFLRDSGQGFWQLLPVTHTGFGDSPYQSVSAFAGNPYFVSPEVLIEEGLLTWDECNGLDFGNDEEQVDYGALYTNRFDLLKKAYERFVEKELDKTDEYKAFIKKEEYWLLDYALYMALKNHHDGAGFTEWEVPLKLREKAALEKAEKELSADIGFYSFIQYKFYEHWEKLHDYAKKQNVKLIGDVSFYVAMDSADVWAHPEVFQLEDDLEAKLVAGCPPDAFSPDGQRWGNPLYDWDALKKNDYDWWIKRIEHNYEIYDVLRIDHFHGFTEYYAVPANEETARNGKQEKGPGIDFFKALEKETGDINTADKIRMIAEDLGQVTEENKELLEKTGIPGMQVLQYAFTDWDSIYIPYRHKVNSVCYTGTHDNTPSRAWFEDIGDGSKNYVRKYINSMNTDVGGFVWDFIREAYRSTSMLCIIPIQDYLVKGREARINEPGTQEKNWKWRLKPRFLSKELANSIKGLSEIYGRIPKEVKEG